MSDTSPLAEELANTLWLLGHAADNLATQTITATRELDDLIRHALQDATDPDAIASQSFLDPDLVRHVHDGGTTLAYFLRGGPPSSDRPGDPR